VPFPYSFDFVSVSVSFRTVLASLAYTVELWTQTDFFQLSTTCPTYVVIY